MILKVDKKTKKCSTISLSQDITEEYYFNKYCLENDFEKFIIVEDLKVPKSFFLKLSENGEIIEDVETINEIKDFKIRNIAKNILTKTDFILLIDNPLDLSLKEIDEIVIFRKNLRKVKKSSDFPKIPDFLKKELKSFIKGE